MKKILALTFISSLLFTVAFGQTINQKEAYQLLNKAWTCIKTNDTVSFINLWSMNDSISKNHRRPHTRHEIILNFDAVKEWLDTALQQNLNIDNITVNEQKLDRTDSKCWIQAWFKYNNHYYKAFGLYLAYYKNKWVVRDVPSTSTLRKP